MVTFHYLEVWFISLTLVTSQRIERICVIPSGSLLISSARYAEGFCAVTELSSTALTSYVASVEVGPPYLHVVIFAWLTTRLTVNKFKLCVKAVVIMYMSVWLVRSLVWSKENALCIETACVCSSATLYDQLKHLLYFRKMRCMSSLQKFVEQAWGSW